MVNIPVFLSSDDNYAPFAATTMASILSHTNEFINFYILDMGISQQNKDKIAKENLYFKNFSLEFVTIDKEKYFKSMPTLSYISEAMYSRYLIADLKPEINRAIYSDVDVIFTGDIKELWQEELHGKMLGAVPSQRGKLNNNYADYKRKLNLSDKHLFFMSGLLLIDCEKWRENKISMKLINKTLALKNTLALPDQEVFNVVFNNNYTPLDKKYSVIYKIFKNCYSPQEIKELIQNQVIIHYPGDSNSKPWYNKKLSSANYFWNIIKYTDFSKEITERYKNYKKQNNKAMIKKFLQKVFSIKNDGYKKRITVLGCKISMTRKSHIYIYINELRQEIEQLKHLLDITVNISLAPPARGYLRKLQLADTISLSIFHEICKKHNLAYWLDYGSLLGAVRHRGFIPWDDDIDVAMMREDYDAIKNILRSELVPFGFEVSEGKNFLRQITRLIYKGTPIQIDIWPYDYYYQSTTNDFEKNYLAEKIKQCNKKFFSIYNQEELSAGKIAFPHDELIKLQNEIVLENKNPDKEGAIFGGSEAIVYTEPNIFNNKEIFPLHETDFENIRLFIPNDSDSYLTKIYKDYMAIPNFKIYGHDSISQNKIDNIDAIILELQNIKDKIMGTN